MIQVYKSKTILSLSQMSINDHHSIPLVEQDGRRYKRNKLQIYHDILDAIEQEKTYGEVKPTRVQFLSNMSYDKLTIYLDDLESKKMITKNPLALADKGKQFLLEYKKINDTVKQLGLEYL